MHAPQTQYKFKQEKKKPFICEEITQMHSEFEPQNTISIQRRA